MARRLGQIIKRGDRWLVRTSWFDEHGTRRTRAVTVDGTRKDAERKLAKLAEQIERIGDVDVELRRQTCGEFLAHWIDRRPGVGPSKKRIRALQLAKHVDGVIGGVRVGDLRRAHVEALRCALEESGLAPGTQHTVFAWLKPAIRDAVDAGALVRDPFAGVKLPSGKRTREPQAFSPDQVRAFLALADQSGSTRTAALACSLALSGARPGEILALGWDDVNLDTGRARIRQAVAEDAAYKPYLKATKTGTVREIILPESALVRLRAHRAEQAREALRAGDERQPLVFPDVHGKLWQPRLAARVLHPLLRQVDPRATVYWLRHSAASLLLAQGVSVAAVAQQLGHANARTTLLVYSHALAGDLERTSAALANALAG